MQATNTPSANSRNSESGAKGKRSAKGKNRLRRKSPWWWRVLRASLLGYGTILIALCVFENHLIYPAAYSDADAVPPAIESDIQTVRYESSADAPLPGRLLMHPDSDQWLVFFHGNGVRARQLDSWLRRLSQAAGANVFAAEYRGYEDDQSPSERGLIEDGISAVDFLTDHHRAQPEQMVYYGRSLGGGVATAVAFERPPKAMVLERTFDSAVNVAAKRFWFIPVQILMRNRFDSAARVTVFDKPLVVVGGTDDQVIPIPHARALHRAASRAPSTMIEVPGLRHNDPIHDDVLSKIFAALENSN